MITSCVLWEGSHAWDLVSWTAENNHYQVSSKNRNYFSVGRDSSKSFMCRFLLQYSIYLSKCGNHVNSWEQGKWLGKLWFIRRMEMQWPVSVWPIEMAVICYPHEAAQIQVGKVWSHSHRTQLWLGGPSWMGAESRTVQVVLPQMPVLYQMGTERDLYTLEVGSAPTRVPASPLLMLSLLLPWCSAPVKTTDLLQSPCRSLPFSTGKPHMCSTLYPKGLQSLFLKLKPRKLTDSNICIPYHSLTFLVDADPWEGGGCISFKGNTVWEVTIISDTSTQVSLHTLRVQQSVLKQNEATTRQALLEISTMNYIWNHW